ncbi:hypothetical protein GCM10007063_18240 [Lentibacillus kapialis]|uniref:Uncharacterized protein n=1 Tax=Lentibacillus kapialis TaxID=340214 RepID=A0A917PWU2_9BACI|nr:permease prefix domain 1-containing protein [Lentibacillus kapialis]GGJ96135.1 hypothetical protein GCM10007063_18240 [Lentibacillus kapialis]
MTRMEQHVEKILEQTQSSGKEREEIREELLHHLNEAKQQNMNNGLTEKQAEKQVMADFGNAGDIGYQMQEAMYPYQRGLLYAVGLATILYGLIYYVNAAFFQHDAIPIWLAVQFVTGCMVILAGINISFVGRYFYMLNVVLLVNVIWNGINITLIKGASPWQTILFSIYLLILVLLGLIAVVQNSYYSSGKTVTKQQSRGVVLLGYGVNLLLGIIVAGVSLFFLWAFLFTTGKQLSALLTIAPIFIWLITYKFQMGYIAKKPLISILTGFGFSVLAITVPVLILVML